MDKDPALYTKFNERLQRILDAHKEHWDIIVIELTKLREELASGRKLGDHLMPEHIAPFYDLIIMIGGIDQENREVLVKVQGITGKIFEVIRRYLQIPNLWQKPSERRRLESEIRDELEYSGIDGVKEKAEHITTELINLAKNREKEVIGSRAG